MPFAGAAIQQQQPPQSMNPLPHGLGPQVAVHTAPPPVPALEVAPAVLDAAPELPPAEVVPPVLLAVVPALLLGVAPAVPPAPELPLSELHAASPTVEEAPVTTRT